MSSAEELLKAVDSQLKREVELFGFKCVVKTLNPQTAAKRIVELQRRTDEIMRAAEGGADDPEQLADEEMIKIMARTVADAVVEPELNSDEREQLFEKLAALPLDKWQELGAVFGQILGTANLRAAMDVREKETEALFRKPSAPLESAKDS